MQEFWKFLTHDWYFAAPMFALSFAALTLIFWRILLNQEAKTDLDAFLPEFQEVLAAQGIAGALSFCRARHDMIPSKLFVSGLESASLGPAAIRRALASAIELEILPELSFLLSPILAIAKIATMVGLLGTVVSMIGTFSAITEDTSHSMTNHAGPIGLALFATAIGLLTATPMVFAHVIFKNRVRVFELQMKSAAQKFTVLIQSYHAALAVPPAPAEAPPAHATVAELQVPPPVRARETVRSHRASAAEMG